MIRIENPYAKLLEYTRAEADLRAEYGTKEMLEPVLERAQEAYRDGAQGQLRACIADLRVWATQYRFKGNGYTAQELEVFARDWEDDLGGTAPCVPVEDRPLVLDDQDAAEVRETRRIAAEAVSQVARGTWPTEEEVVGLIAWATDKIQSVSDGGERAQWRLARQALGELFDRRAADERAR